MVEIVSAPLTGQPQGASVADRFRGLGVGMFGDGLSPLPAADTPAPTGEVIACGGGAQARRRRAQAGRYQRIFMADRPGADVGPYLRASASNTFGPGDPRTGQAPGASPRADARKRFFRRNAQQGRFAERKAMIDREHDLPITQQTETLNVSRGSVFWPRFCQGPSPGGLLAPPGVPGGTRSGFGLPVAPPFAP
jgi:hypothetical protein